MSTDPATPSPSRRQWYLLAGAVAVVAIAGVVVALLIRHHTSSHATLPTPTTTPQQSLSAGGRELVSLLASGRTVTFHAKYTAVGGPAVLAGLNTIEVWQAPPNLREDTTQTRDGAVTKTASFAGVTNAHGCASAGGKAWVCHHEPVGPARGPQGLLATLGYDMSGRLVTVTDEVIGGRRVRCFTASGASAPAELCATAAGIPVLISGGGVRFELTALDSSVPSSIFTPPVADS